MAPTIDGVELSTPLQYAVRHDMPKGVDILAGSNMDEGTEFMSTTYGTFRSNFHRFDRFELDLRGHIHVRGAAFSYLRLKLADIVLI